MCVCVCVCVFIFLLIVRPKKGLKVVLKRPKLKISCRTKKKSCWSFVNHRLSFVEEIMAMIFTGEEQPQPKFFFVFMMKSALHFYCLS